MSTVYKHILLATDLSPESEFTAKRAANMASLFNAKLSIVHVLCHSPVAYGGEFTLPMDAKAQDAAKEQAIGQFAKIGKKYDIPEKSQHVKNGEIKSSITHLAESISADLIVVGTHSRHGISKLLGSEASDILKNASTDLWVIRIK